MPDTIPERELENSAEGTLARKTRRAFLTMGIGAVAGIAGWRWLWGGGEEDSDELPPRVKRILEFNGRSSSRLLYKTDHLAQGFPLSQAKMPKVNGEEGLGDDVDPARIAYVGHSYNAHTGGILAGVEKRIGSLVLMAGVFADEEYVFDSTRTEVTQFREKIGEQALRVLQKRDVEIMVERKTQQQRRRHQQDFQTLGTLPQH